MTHPIIRFPYGFNTGFTPILEPGDKTNSTGLGFGILRMKAGEKSALRYNEECAVLMLSGKILLSADTRTYEFERSSLFNENPSAFHCGMQTEIILEAQSPSELAVCRAVNSAALAPVYHPKTALMEAENRGRGILDDTSYRIVRTVIDKRNAPDSNMVLGEVVNFPGRWSSYPPHHHTQPEIYHYRFTEPQGYGHAESGDAVYKVKQNDTFVITGGLDHPQTAAPGYGMYYLWLIRHLPGNPYITPEFTEEHKWTLGQ